MSWQRAALDERLEILKEQLREQLSGEDRGWREWLEHQIQDLMAVAASFDHGDYVSRETRRVLAAISHPVDGSPLATATASIAMTDPAAG